MPEASDIIEQIIRQKDRFVITGQQKVLRLLEELRRRVMDELGSLALSEWKEQHLQQVLAEIERAADEYVRRAQQELQIDLRSLWDLGQESVYRPLNAGGIYTGFGISQATLDALSEFTFHKIANLVRDALDKIKTELTLGVLGQKTPQQIADAIGRNLTSPGVFKSVADRAEVIVKTELGRMFSIAAEKRRQQAAQYVPGLIKIWDHAGHPARPRPGHLAIHGKQVPVNEPFMVADRNNKLIPMMYPHDPNAPIEEVINCGCDAVTWKDSWGPPPRTFRRGGRPGTLD